MFIYPYRQSPWCSSNGVAKQATNNNILGPSQPRVNRKNSQTSGFFAVFPDKIIFIVISQRKPKIKLSRLILTAGKIVFFYSE